MGIRTFFQSRSLRKLEQVNNRHKEMKHMSKIHTVLILFSVPSLKSLDKWKQHFNNLSREKIKFSYIFYVQQKNESDFEQADNSLTFFHSSLKWNGLLKETNSLNELIQKKFDLVIDLNFENVFLLNWIFVKANTALRVGYGHQTTLTSFYDLTILTNDPKNQPKLYIDQVFYFLDKINSNEIK